MSRVCKLGVLFLLATSTVGCLSPYSSDDPNGPGGDNGDGGTPGTSIGPDGARVGTRALRRLTPAEYDNSVRDVFALPASWSGAGLGPDASNTLNFDNDASLLTVDDARAQDLEAAAEKIADLVVASGLNSLGACAPVSRACAVAVVDKFAPRLFRRAVTDADKKPYLDSYDAVAAMATPADGLKWTLVALLDSPNFLYRFELGTPGDNGTFNLTGEELASALAYTFSASPPSDALLEQGRSGALATADQRLAVAKQLLDSPRGHEVMDAFMRRWLRYDEVRSLVKDDAVVPGFAALRTDMAEETRRFLEHIVFESQGGVNQLFSSSETFVSAALAQHYGLPAPAQPFALTQRPPEQSLGVLAQGSILSRFALTHTSSPPQRGAFVRRRFLCQDLPAPPPNVGQPPVPQPGLTTRELFEQVHTQQAGCASCHNTIDPIGFGLEAFDTAGRWRTTENGKPIRADGKIINFGSQPDATFADGKGLAQVLAQSPDVAKCVGSLMSAYAFGTVDGRVFAAPAQTTAIAGGQLALHEFFAQLAAAPNFSVRAEK